MTTNSLRERWGDVIPWESFWEDLKLLLVRTFERGKQEREADYLRVCRALRKGQMKTKPIYVRSRAGALFIPGFEVMNLKTHASHGVYKTLEEAKGCVAYDKLTSWQIWHNESTLVAERDMS